MSKKTKVNTALLIIGNEILSGRTQDTNTSTLALWLNSIGVKVREVKVVPDVEEKIISSVNLLRNLYDYVFTTGGIGPTHDDITAQSIAKAFNLDYEIHKEGYKILEAYYKPGEFNEGRQKMIWMPKNAKLLLKNVGLKKYENSFPHKLSGGMQRRIALARAFSTNPNLLLLDEPFISLDKKIADQLRDLLINLWKKNKPTIVFVTHDLDEAITLSDRIIFISKLPSKIQLDYKINITRPRDIDSSKIKSLKRLLSATVKN